MAEIYKVDRNGVVVDMAPEEIAELQISIPSEPTTDEKLEEMATNVNDMMLAIMYLSIE